jgi:hypothetical protein
VKKHTFLSKKFSVSFLLTLFLSAHLISCQDDTEGQREYPRVKTLEVVNIDHSGATFRGEVESLGNSPVDSYGFVWGTNEQLSVSANDFVDIDIQFGSSYFETRVQRALETQRNYYVRAYARVKGKTIYSEAVLFKSLGSEAPQITSFEPRTAAWGDTITIKGKNFSNVASQLKLNFGIARVPTSGFVENPSDSMIIVQVPFGLSDNECYLSVDIFGNTRQFNSYRFKLVPPTISDFSPKTAGWGDIITATGSYLNNPNLKYTLGGIEIKKFNFTSRNTITLTVPDELSTLENSLRAEFNSISASASTTLKLQQPAITGFTPATATWGQEVTVNGGFHYNKAYSKIFFNTTEATILDYSKNSIKVAVPLELTSPNPSGAIPLYYKTHNIQVQANNSFELQGPSITSFSPQQAGAGSRITVEGNFSTKNTKIYFGDKEATIFSITQQRLVAIVPSNTSGMVKIKAVVGSQVAVSTDDFEAKNPKIIDFYPKTAGFGDEITLEGEYLDINPTETTVRFTSLSSFNSNPNHGVVAEVISISTNSLKLIVPEGLSDLRRKISLKVGNIYQIIEEDFNLSPPIITSFTPTEGGSYNEITIYGNHFASSPIKNSVFFGEIEALVIINERNRIVVQVPNLTRGSYNLTVKWGEQADTSPTPFELKSPWSGIDYSPLEFLTYPTIPISFNGKVYLYTQQLDIYRYRNWVDKLIVFNPVTRSFEKFDFPSNPFNTSHLNSTVINSGSQIINITSHGEVYSFCIQDKMWYRLKDFPGEYIKLGFSFNIGDRIFIGGGDNSAFWEYNPVDDTWIQKDNLPFKTSYGDFNSAVAIEKGYLILSNGDVWEYNPISDTWAEKSKVRDNEWFFATCFVLNNLIYYGTGSRCKESSDVCEQTQKLFAYDPTTDRWEEKPATPCRIGRNRSSSFTISGKAYWGFGVNYENYPFIGRSDFYEYDPTLEP